MQAYFKDLSEKLCAGLPEDEVLLLNYQGEDSDFVRLNSNKVRQAGHVRQQTLHLDLINNGREASARFCPANGCGSSPPAPASRPSLRLCAIRTPMSGTSRSS